jgi:guanylate kinase
MSVGNPASRGLLVVISGPSGVGKTSILREVLRRTGAVFSVSATTRSPAAGERDGVDYYFIDRETFQRWVDERRFIEVAQVFGRNWYGTPREPVERQLADGKIVVLDIDVQGAAEVKRYMPECLAIFILPPSEDELHRRLRGRRRDDRAGRRNGGPCRALSRQRHRRAADPLPRAHGRGAGAAQRL